MATFQDTISLPETRTALEELIEAAIARLDELDPDPDLEPTLGAPLPPGIACADVGRWMAEQANPLAGVSACGELYRESGLSQEHWSEGNPLDETEDVSEDEGAQDDREPEEDDWDPDSEDWGPAMSFAVKIERAICGREDWRTRQTEQVVTTQACQAAVDELRTVQLRLGRLPVDRLRVLGGAILR